MAWRNPGQIGDGRLAGGRSPGASRGLTGGRAAPEGYLRSASRTTTSTVPEAAAPSAALEETRPAAPAGVNRALPLRVPCPEASSAPIAKRHASQYAQRPGRTALWRGRRAAAGPASRPSAAQPATVVATEPGSRERTESIRRWRLFLRDCPLLMKKCAQSRRSRWLSGQPLQGRSVCPERERRGCAAQVIPAGAVVVGKAASAATAFPVACTHATACLPPPSTLCQKPSGLQLLNLGCNTKISLSDPGPKLPDEYYRSFSFSLANLNFPTRAWSPWLGGCPGCPMTRHLKPDGTS